MENNSMFELIFIPCPMPGHIVSFVEFVNQLLSHHPRIQVTVLLMKSPWNNSSSSSSSQQDPQDEEEEAKADASSDQKSSSTNYSNHGGLQIRYIDLPDVQQENLPPQHLFEECPEAYVCTYIASYTPQVRAAIDSAFKHHPPAALVLDMFCISMIDVANELGIPSYLFFTSGAAFLGLFLQLHALNINLKEDGMVFTESDDKSESDLQISTFVNPLPSRLLPAAFIQKTGYNLFSDLGKRFVETRGIIINTFEELEPYATNSLKKMTNSGLIPPVYNVGPFLDLKGQAHGNPNDKQREPIMAWLDDQPESSVVFLCFGSRGSFSDPQVKEIANGLQDTGTRFLWSLRKPPGEKLAKHPVDYTDAELKELLPDSFWPLLQGDERRGLVCGWAPQVEVLAHRAVGAFVSHCGWNSTLESLWFGIPIVTWPLYAEQHFNAFNLIKELGLGVELRIDYRREMGDVIRADEFQRAIRCVMDHENPIRKRVADISEISKRALMDTDGSSFKAIARLIRDMETIRN